MRPPAPSGARPPGGAESKAASRDAAARALRRARPSGGAESKVEVINFGSCNQFGGWPFPATCVLFSRPLGALTIIPWELT